MREGIDTRCDRVFNTYMTHAQATLLATGGFGTFTSAVLYAKWLLVRRWTH